MNIKNTVGQSCKLFVTYVPYEKSILINMNIKNIVGQSCKLFVTYVPYESMVMRHENKS
jgi:hypothetical protein